MLLVEDDLQVATLVTDMLESTGHCVLRAASADAALDLLACEAEVDFLLSDIMMPGATSGMDLARQVRSSRPDLPILLGSGFDEPSRVEAGRAGMAKPYSLQQLQTAMLRTRSGMPADCALPRGRAAT